MFVITAIANPTSNGGYYNTTIPLTFFFLTQHHLKVLLGKQIVKIVISRLIFSLKNIMKNILKNT